MLISLLVLAGQVVAVPRSTTRAANPWPAPGPPTMQVAWLVLATPDEAATDAGAVPFETAIAVGSRLIDYKLTGAGCIVGPFPSPEVSMRAEPGPLYRFEATSRKDDGASASWTFTLRDSKVAGEIVLTHPGKPTPRQEVEEKERKEIAALSDRAIRSARGVIINQQELRELEQEIHLRRNKAVAPGRTLRFRFQTVETRISAVGAWPLIPATQPVERARETTTRGS